MLTSDNSFFWGQKYFSNVKKSFSSPPKKTNYTRPISISNWPEVLAIRLNLPIFDDLWIYHSVNHSKYSREKRLFTKKGKLGKLYLCLLASNRFHWSWGWDGVVVYFDETMAEFGSYTLGKVDGTCCQLGMLIGRRNLAIFRENYPSIRR